jgi:hypothetical protein
MFDILPGCERHSSRSSHASDVLDDAFSENHGYIRLILIESFGHCASAARIVRPFCRF